MGKATKYKSMLATKRGGPEVLQIISSALGIYAGLLGIEHGFFETLQGNIARSKGK
jgi:hypothetical protein